MTVRFRTVAAILLSLTLAGCATYPANPTLDKVDPNAGYRFNNLSAPEAADSLFVILTFSGGGTRAAALSYGVMEKLRNTRIVWEGQHRRLLDEIDVISSVSGGSFTAAYYGLFRDQLFEQFARQFLYRDIEAELKALLFSPANWIRLASPTFGRIDLASELYDREIFHGKTYGDLLQMNQRPFVMVNATDMSIGARFTFIQEQFDLLCSDLTGVKVARAVAASSNFPVAFTPLTMNNYAGGCGYTKRRWMENAAKDLQLNPARYKRGQQSQSYLDAKSRPYIHLLDGGVADNIGLRGPLVALQSNDLGWALPNKINSRGTIKKLVVIIVDAKTDPAVTFDQSPSPPGLFDVLKTIATVPLDNFSFDTVQALRDTFKSWRKDRQSYAACQMILRDSCPATSMPSGPPPPVDLFGIYVGFDQISDAKKRRYFQNMATSFYLPKKQVDELRDIAKTLLDDSQDYRDLIDSLR